MEGEDDAVVPRARARSAETADADEAPTTKTPMVNNAAAWMPVLVRRRFIDLSLE
ncbi:hypothetical protein [Embleya sp. NPDC001921]